MGRYIVTMTSPIIEADSPEEAIRWADDHGGNEWSAAEAPRENSDFGQHTYPQVQWEIIEPHNVAEFTAKNGVRFRARILREGDVYGPGQLFWLHEDKAGVEFFDTRYPHTEHGQFTGGRYYVESILKNGDNGDSQSAWGGLILDGGNADSWSIDEFAMFVVRQWLHHETGEIG